MLCPPELPNEERLLTPHSSKVSSLLLAELGYILVICQMFYVIASTLFKNVGKKDEE